VDTFRAFLGEPADKTRVPVKWVWLSDEERAERVRATSPGPKQRVAEPVAGLLVLGAIILQVFPQPGGEGVFGRHLVVRLED